MPRPVKCRFIEHEPGVVLFKPAGIPASRLERVELSVEELEAVRLKDMEGLDQQQAAERMNVSRPTFQRILKSARSKITDALVSGKVIHISGGTYSVAGALLRCVSCGFEWRSRDGRRCPKCECPRGASSGAGRCARQAGLATGEKSEREV